MSGTVRGLWCPGCVKDRVFFSAGELADHEEILAEHYEKCFCYYKSLSIADTTFNTVDAAFGFI